MPLARPAREFGPVSDARDRQLSTRTAAATAARRLSLIAIANGRSTSSTAAISWLVTAAVSWALATASRACSEIDVASRADAAGGVPGGQITASSSIT